jgi:hypothetical protein
MTPDERRVADQMPLLLPVLRDAAIALLRLPLDEMKSVCERLRVGAVFNGGRSTLGLSSAQLVNFTAMIDAAIEFRDKVKVIDAAEAPKPS